MADRNNPSILKKKRPTDRGLQLSFNITLPRTHEGRLRGIQNKITLGRKAQMNSLVPYRKPASCQEALPQPVAQSTLNVPTPDVISARVTTPQSCQPVVAEPILDAKYFNHAGSVHNLQKPPEPPLMSAYFPKPP